MRRWTNFVRWFLAACGALFLATIAAAIWWRLPLAGWVLRNTLADAGALPRELRVTEVSLHHATISPLAFEWKGQQVRVDSVTLDRPDVFSRSLGQVAVKGISVVLDLRAWGVTRATPDGAAAKQPSAPIIKFDDLSVDGQLVLRLADSSQRLTLGLLVKPDAAGNVLRANVKLEGPGLETTGRGSYDLASSSGDFELSNARLNLAEASALLTGILPVPLAGWEVGGTVIITGGGRVANGGLTGGMTLQLRDGVLRNAGRKVVLEGIEGEIVATDLARFATLPAQALRMKAAQVGDVELHDLSVRYQVKSLHQVWIESAAVGAFGGMVTIDPFGFDPAGTDYAVTLQCDGLRVEEIMSLFPTANAKASGLADGRIPMHYGPQGFGFSHGWLALKPGTPGTLRIDQPGLLTGNLPPQNVAYPTMKAVETGLLNLRVDTLRAEIYPPDAPAGRSVQIIIAGQPLDPKVKAPVTFEVNVNGPVEKLIQWGLDSRMKISTK